MLQLAHDYVYFTSESVFLTGKAGTGKTTFLKQLREHCPKQHVVLAPTGVAAINAGGTTIHSFFQLPFSPFVPGPAAPDHNGATGKQGLLARLRYGREKRELMRSIDLLIIDEVSMVRCDVLDAIDTVLRHVRHNSQPFGGVQMLFIGDMYQLPPVVQEPEWEILREFYDGPFFFNSHAIRQQPPVYIELQTIYRQSDERFIALLNQVRNNQLTPEGLHLLNSRFVPGFKPPKDKHYITLSTHNRKADAINEQELAALPGQVWSYKAEVQGEFNEKNYPADETLHIKAGAQVMFLRNDAQGKRFFNGKIGVVVDLDADHISVQCPGEDKPISVKPETWRNVQYSLNKSLQQVEEKEIGSFTQFPLRLAWAVTIHKSQGLTFEHAVIDAAYSFSAGQVYVALSRCKSLEGMVLLSRVPLQAVMVDQRVQQYASGARPETELQRAFGQHRRQFQEQLLRQAFDAVPLQKALAGVQAVLNAYPHGFGDQVLPWWQELLQQCQVLEDTSQKFLRQLQEAPLANEATLEENTWVQGRVQKAAVWFGEQLTGLMDPIRNHPAVSDSEEQALELEEALGQLLAAVKQWQQYAEACRHGFDTVKMLRAKSKAQIAELSGTAYAGSARRRQQVESSDHPALMLELRQLRDALCAQHQRPIYMVASSGTLQELVRYLPQTPEELLQITGFGSQKVAQFGEAFLEPIVRYCGEHGLESQVHLKEGRRKRKEKTAREADTKRGTREEKIPSRDISYQRWQQGLSVADIAAERNLQPSTIEGHLVEFVRQGILPMEALVSAELQQRIAEVALDLQAVHTADVRSVLGDEASYNQIRLVMEKLVQEGRLAGPALTGTAAAG